MWYVYIVQCSDDTLYTGVTTDLQRRTEEHNSSKLGARYTRSRRPVSLIYHEQMDNRSQAGQREAEIKRLTRKQKEKLIKARN